jgi:hypothetical protein
MEFSKNIIYADNKTENILMTQDNQLELIYFEFKKNESNSKMIKIK